MLSPPSSLSCSEAINKLLHRPTFEGPQISYTSLGHGAHYKLFVHAWRLGQKSKGMSSRVAKHEAADERFGRQVHLGGNPGMLAWKTWLAHYV